MIILPYLLYNLVVLDFFFSPQLPFDIARVLINNLFTYISSILKLSPGRLLYIRASLCIEPFRWSLHFILVHELSCTPYEFWQLSVIFNWFPRFLQTLKLLMLQLKVSLEVIWELTWLRFSLFTIRRILVERGLNDIFFNELGGSSRHILHFI